MNHPFLLHAMEIFSQLITLDLNKDEVVILNQEDDLITNAYVVSVADLRAKKLKKRKISFQLKLTTPC